MKRRGTGESNFGRIHGCYVAQIASGHCDLRNAFEVKGGCDVTSSTMSDLNDMWW